MLQGIDLGQIIDHDVGISGVMDQEVLMIALGRVEALQRFDLGDNRGIEHMRASELRDIGLRDLLLGGVREENLRAIAAA